MPKITPFLWFNDQADVEADLQVGLPSSFLSATLFGGDRLV